MPQKYFAPKKRVLCSSKGTPEYGHSLLFRLIDCTMLYETGPKLLEITVAKLSGGKLVGFVKLIGNKPDVLTFANAMLEEAELMEDP